MVAITSLSLAGAWCNSACDVTVPGSEQPHITAQKHDAMSARRRRSRAVIKTQPMLFASLPPHQYPGALRTLARRIALVAARD
jgi:hypothetical protein